MNKDYFIFVILITKICVKLKYISVYFKEEYYE